MFDVLDSMSPRRQYSIAADTAVALGLAGAVGAAATGLTDWQEIAPLHGASRQLHSRREGKSGSHAMDTG